MMHNEQSLDFHKIYEFLPLFVPFTWFCLIYVFCFPYFDHDAIMHHALHVYWTLLNCWIIQASTTNYRSYFCFPANSNSFYNVLDEIATLSGSSIHFFQGLSLSLYFCLSVCMYV